MDPPKREKKIRIEEKIMPQSVFLGDFYILLIMGGGGGKSEIGQKFTVEMK